MRNSIFLLALLCLIGVAVAEGARSGAIPGMGNNRQMTAVVDSIMYRKDVTRVYCRVLGRPNTSHRINAVTMKSGSQAFAATDIDPIYFERSFQWEEDGQIPLEIDFPAMKTKLNEFQLVFDTPYGAVTSQSKVRR